MGPPPPLGSPAVTTRGQFLCVLCDLCGCILFVGISPHIESAQIGENLRIGLSPVFLGVAFVDFGELSRVAS